MKKGEKMVSLLAFLLIVKNILKILGCLPDLLNGYS